MNFQEAVQAVLDITKRPDKKVDTERAVNSALSFFHTNARFDQDRTETSLAIPADTLAGTVSISTLLRFRVFAVIKARNNRIPLSKIDPANLFSPDAITQVNKYYVAGTDLTYILAVSDTILDCLYYTYPAILAGVETDWMLEAIPSSIIDRAASTIFKQIGDDTSFQIHNGLAIEVFKSFLRDKEQP